MNSDKSLIWITNNKFKIQIKLSVNSVQKSSKKNLNLLASAVKILLNSINFKNSEIIARCLKYVMNAKYNAPDHHQINAFTVQELVI